MIVHAGSDGIVCRFDHLERGAIAAEMNYVSHEHMNEALSETYLGGE